jgi:hypothetical protein
LESKESAAVITHRLADHSTIFVSSATDPLHPFPEANTGPDFYLLANPGMPKTEFCPVSR